MTYKLPIRWYWVVAMALFYVAVTALTHANKPLGSAVLVLGLVAFNRPLLRLLDATLVDSWRLLNAEAQQERAREVVQGSGKTAYDLRPLVVLCTTAVCLTLIEYFGDRGTYSKFITAWANTFFHSRYYELSTYAYWTGSRVVGYVLLPWLVVLLMPGERIRDHGLTTKGLFKHVWIYGVLFAIVLPAVVMVSYTKGFQHTYPFYKLAARSWTDFLLWEALYGLQFWALEVFFRGFMIHPLKRSMGANAILCMAVPYCMIHYHKPLPEVLGAVAAGTVLGTLSLRTGSIWCGVLIHISVAWSMDVLSMIQTVGIPGQHAVIG